MQGAARRGRHHRAGELQPCHDNDRRGHRRCRLYRAAHRRGAHTHHRCRASRRHPAHAWRTDRAEPSRGTSRCRRTRRVQRASSRHALADHPQRRGPRAVPAVAVRHRRACTAQRNRRVHGRGSRGAEDAKSALGHTPGIHAWRHGRRHRYHARRVQYHRRKRTRRKPH